MDEHAVHACWSGQVVATTPLTSLEHHHKAVDTFALLEVGFDDLVNVLKRGHAVPDSTGIDDQQGTRVTKSKAARHRETNMVEALRFDRLAHSIPQGLRA